MKGRGTSPDSSAAASTLAHVLSRHTARKDVARACVRSIMNLSKYPTALASLIGTGALARYRGGGGGGARVGRGWAGRGPGGARPPTRQFVDRGIPPPSLRLLSCHHTTRQLVPALSRQIGAASTAARAGTGHVKASSQHSFVFKEVRRRPHTHRTPPTPCIVSGVRVFTPCPPATSPPPLPGRLLHHVERKPAIHHRHDRDHRRVQPTRGRSGAARKGSGPV